MFKNNQITELQAQIKQLKKDNAISKQENALLKAGLREIIDTAHQAINKEAKDE